MFNWKKWLLFVLLGFIGYVILLFAITDGIKIYFGLNSADTLAFAQLVLSTLLLPAVLFGFIITVQAFRESQELPDLDVFFETETGLHEKSLKFKGNAIFQQHFTESHHIRASHKPIPLVIVNKGNAIAVWYSIHIIVRLTT